ncbi:hypothetical protein Tco_0028293 [Tanacetum coccineum]
MCSTVNYGMEEDKKPAIVLDESCISQWDFSLSLVGKVKNFSSLSNLKIVLASEGIIYPNANSPWLSPIHCVPKKYGITIVTNKNDELVPTRTVMGWRVYINYHKLNEATAKDHFPLPFYGSNVRKTCRK